METSNYLPELIEGFKKKEQEIVRPTILVAGITGIGKTSLIQAICGKDIVSDDKIAHYAPGTQDFNEYKDARVRFWDSKGLEVENADAFIARTKKFIESTRKKTDVDEHIHLVWYCIGVNTNRVQPADVEILNSVFNKNHILVLLTQNDTDRGDKSDKMKQHIIKQTGIRSNRILKVSDTDKSALLTVMKATYELLPGAYKNAWMAAQVLDIEYKKSKAHGIIHLAALAAAAVGTIPIPGSDAPLLVGIQTGMIGSLALLYGIGKEATMTALGPALASALGVASASSLVKIFPLIGSVVQGSVAAAITETLGWTTQVYLARCALAKLEGRPIPTLNIDEDKVIKMAREFEDRYKKELPAE